MTIRVRHGGTEQRIGPAGVATRLPSGAVLRARAQAAQEPHARALGYADARELTRHHDPAHAWLAAALGLSVSPALSAASGEAVDPALTVLEEAAVLALQAYAVRLGIEPWLIPPTGERP